jgi:hypothetical protein
MVIPGAVQKWRAWETRFARYRTSGLSVARFCAQERVSTNTFYYWAKRLKAASGQAAARNDPQRRPQSPAALPTRDSNARQAVVQFRWSTGAEVWVPADCLEALRVLAECLARTGGRPAEAFQEVVVKA